MQFYGLHFVLCAVCCISRIFQRTAEKIGVNFKFGEVMDISASDQTTLAKDTDIILMEDES